MTITLNGRPEALESPTTLAALLERLGYVSGFAVALNREFVPRGEYERTRIAPGDELEVLAARQGG